MSPNKTLDDDVHQIRKLALQDLDAGRDIVALMHSYGGVVGSNALAGLGAADREKGGHVKALIYMQHSSLSRTSPWPASLAENYLPG